MVNVVTAPMEKLVNDMFVQSIHLRCETCNQLLRVLNVGLIQRTHSDVPNSQVEIKKEPITPKHAQKVLSQ